ncbi:MAG: nickel ABC transporter permease [Thermaerobacterales bacterium]
MTLSYFLKRMVQAVVLILLATVVVFLLIHLTPGDAAEMMAGDYASQETVESIRKALGLDRPLHEQYAIYLGNLLRGDLGTSIRAQRPVLTYMLARFPATIELSLFAFTFAVVIGVPVGVLSAVRRYSLTDTTATFVALVGQAAPGFWLGLMAIVLFSVHLRWLPVSGRGTFEHLILPGITLSLATLALTIRLTRSGMLDVLKQDFIRTARSKGLSERVVIYRHALRNAILPVVTILGLSMGTMLGGAVVTETVFAWPGIGQLAVQAVLMRDYPLVQGIVLIGAVVFILINLIVDFCYLQIDPRIRLGGDES